MSSIHDLIAKLCPSGVCFKRLGDVARIKNGKDHKTLADGKYPVYGSGGIMRYANSYAYDKPSVLIPRKGSLDNLFFVDTPFWNVDTIFYTEIDEAQIYPKFFYYFLQTVGLGEMNQAGGVPSQTQSVLNEIKIPVPPIQIQAEIVRILDAMTAHTAELTAELTARKKQYNYFRDKLLSFEDGEVEWQRLIDACDYVDYRGKTPVKTEKGVFLVTAKNIRMGYIDYAASEEFVSKEDYSVVMRRGLPKNGDILITTEAPCGFVAQVDRENIALAQRVIKYRSKNKKLSNNFIKHYLISSHFQNKLMNAATGSTVKGIKGSKLHQLTIPIPSEDEQARIVTILDKFDALTTSITEGLPREIELRQKQYAYYRDLLLSFPQAQTA